MNNELIPQYSTVLFTDVWESVNDFAYDYQHVGIPVTINVATSATTLYYLLYARYGNTPIANNDITQFKYKIFSIVYQYGPTWEKRLDIQKKLRDLTDADILSGPKAIYNNALNPSTSPSTGSLDELTYINSQNTTNYKKSKMDAYMQLWDLLKTDITEEFLAQFRKCFKQFVAPERPLIYISDEDEEE